MQLNFDNFAHVRCIERDAADGGCEFTVVLSDGTRIDADAADLMTETKLRKRILSATGRVMFLCGNGWWMGHVEKWMRASERDDKTPR